MGSSLRLRVSVLLLEKNYRLSCVSNLGQLSSLKLFIVFCSCQFDEGLKKKWNVLFYIVLQGHVAVFILGRFFYLGIHFRHLAYKQFILQIGIGYNIVHEKKSLILIVFG